MAETSVRFRRIEALAALVGHYCWTEHRIFELTGAWATAPLTAEAPAGDGPADDGHVEGCPVEAELRVWCAAASRRHGVLATCWAERLPVRAGVDPSVLVVAPPGPLTAAFERLGSEVGARTLGAGVAGLAGAVLPRLAAAYGTHLDTASAVSEAPVVEVLVHARRVASGEVRGGRALIDRLAGVGGRTGDVPTELNDCLATVPFSLLNGRLDTATTLSLQTRAPGKGAGCVLRARMPGEVPLPRPIGWKVRRTSWPRNVLSATTKTSYASI